MRTLVPWRRKQRDGGNGGELMRLRDDLDTVFDRFFSDPWGLMRFDRPRGFGLVSMPQMDVAETEREFVVTMELPGVDPKDVDINISGDTLHVRGEKRSEREEKGRSYHYTERTFGGFHRSVPLPSSVDPDKVDAGYRNGVLTVTIGKHPDAKPRRVSVRAG